MGIADEDRGADVRPYAANVLRWGHCECDVVTVFVELDLCFVFDLLAGGQEGKFLVWVVGYDEGMETVQERWGMR